MEERTAWSRNVSTPLREFLGTETGSAVVLLAATIAALAWVNVDAHSYDTVWSTTLSIDVGGSGVALDLREWVNSGLMTFFFVVGLEARREFDLGELRQRRRFALPLLVGPRFPARLRAFMLTVAVVGVPGLGTALSGARAAPRGCRASAVSRARASRCRRS